ncbi:MAG: CCA tRNA nucleotidyltransferase [Candidatus Coprovivens sp.]
MINVSESIIDILKEINKKGYEAYLVGGAVRDSLLGKENKDFDICTNMPLTEIKTLYPNFHLMKPNNNRNTGVMRLNNLEIEISEFKGASLLEDLSNRDFTINAIAMDKDGRIIDPFNGIESLNKKEMSLIRQTGEAFIIDPLRILRAIRIAARMNFSIDENCQKEMLKNKNLLESVAAERIYRELIQILITDNPAKYIRDNINIFFQILPELKPLQGFEQQNPWHIYDVLEHTLVVLENTPKNIFVRFAALFHDIGKPKTFFIGEDGKGHFYGHQEVSAQIFDNISSRLKMDNKTKKIVRQLIEKHDMTLSREPEKICQFIKENGIDFTKLLFELKKADNKGQNPYLALTVLEELENLEKIYLGYIMVTENLQINIEKINQLGIRRKKLKIIIDDVIKQILKQNVENTEKDIVSYIERRYK